MLYRHKCPHRPNTCYYCCSEDLTLNSIQLILDQWWPSVLPTHSASSHTIQLLLSRHLERIESTTRVAEKKQSFQKQPVASNATRTLRPYFCNWGRWPSTQTRSTLDVGRSEWRTRSFFRKNVKQSTNSCRRLTLSLRWRRLANCRPGRPNAEHISFP